MPRPRKSKNLPRTASQLAVVCQGLDAPADAQSIFDAVVRSLKAGERGFNPVATFNRSLASVIRRNQNSLGVLEDWLRDPLVYRRLDSLGQSATVVVWLNAIIQLRSGKTALQAFGARQGPAPFWKLSNADLLAAQVLLEIKKNRNSTEGAIVEVMDIFVENGGNADDRNLRKKLAVMRESNLSEDEIVFLSAK
jgi:hypothetical protein